MQETLPTWFAFILGGFCACIMIGGITLAHWIWTAKEEENHVWKFDDETDDNA